MKHLQEKDRVPKVTFKTRVRDASLEGPNPFRWQDLKTDEIFKEKNIVLFSLPGAFTPTCSSTHAPGYEKNYKEFKKLGVDQILCLSVNDAFTMFKWGKDLKIKNVFMLPDGNAEFTEKMGMLVKKEDIGFGSRSWRYSMHVVNGVIQKIFVEKGFKDNCKTDPFEVSGADTMLTYLKSK